MCKQKLFNKYLFIFCIVGSMTAMFKDKGDANYFDALIIDQLIKEYGVIKIRQEMAGYDLIYKTIMETTGFNIPSYCFHAQLYFSLQDTDHVTQTIFDFIHTRETKSDYQPETINYVDDENNVVEQVRANNQLSDSISYYWNKDKSGVICSCWFRNKNLFETMLAHYEQ